MGVDGWELLASGWPAPGLTDRRHWLGVSKRDVYNAEGVDGVQAAMASYTLGTCACGAA